MGEETGVRSSGVWLTPRFAIRSSGVHSGGRKKKEERRKKKEERRSCLNFDSEAPQKRYFEL
jgi:hypothetical protein